MITLDRVDLPEPFGPIRAWVSPCFTTRSIPLRISLPSTFACRSMISSDAAPFVSVICHLDQDVVAFGLDGEHVHRQRRRQRGGPPRVQVERGTVLRALDRLVVQVDLALVQEVVRVRADGVHDPEPLFAQVRDGERPAPDPEAAGLALPHPRERAHLHERDPRAAPASSFAMAASAPSRTSSICTRSSTSWKNPETIRR